MVECVCIDKLFAGYVSPIPRYLLPYSWVFPDRLITYLLVTSVISPRKEPPSPIAARCNAVSGIGAWVRGWRVRAAALQPHVPEQPDTLPGAPGRERRAALLHALFNWASPPKLTPRSALS